MNDPEQDKINTNAKFPINMQKVKRTQNKKNI